MERIQCGRFNEFGGTDSEQLAEEPGQALVTVELRRSEARLPSEWSPGYTWTMLRRLLAAVTGLVAVLNLSATGGTQPAGELEILSKADAIRLFGLSKSEWLQEVRSAVAAGSAVQTADQSPPIIGMTTTTTEGDLLTVRLDYSGGNRKPRFIQVAVGYRRKTAGKLTDGQIREAIAAAQRQMAPEFEVQGNADRVQDGVGVFFIIVDKRR